MFTFGAGTHGQLGHNLTRDEQLPKKVFELMGSTVTMIACGRSVIIKICVSRGLKIVSSPIPSFFIEPP